ncbi:hypothetical protein ACJ8BR_25535, partial [Klebsiella pneumoniae]
LTSIPFVVVCVFAFIVKRFRVFRAPLQSAMSSITKSEPTGKPAGPHDLEFDDFGNGERWQILI